MESSLQTLLDEAAIRKLHLRYCRGVDRQDWELIRSCYHPDATDDHGSFKGGVDAFIEWLMTAMKKFESTTHFTGNQLVEVLGDTAWAEHYARAYHRRIGNAENPEVDLVANVRYVDRLERRNGEWRISNRIVVIDSDRLDKISQTWLSPDFINGRRDKSDPSFMA